MSTDSVVRARIPADMKDKAVSVLHSMGLTSSDLIRLVFERVAEDGWLPFENFDLAEESIPMGRWLVENACDISVEIDLPPRIEDRQSPFDTV